MQELMWLALALAAGAGWIAARRNTPQNSESPRGRTLASDYYEGLNYLLNEQQDQAIEVFVRMLEVNSDTVEIHLALGNLYRRRGEVDRAIRLHQNLIARPTLNRQQREQALLELGQDYMRAGLLDRAERIFQELAQAKAYTRQALEQLLDVYQQEKDWEKAITTARALEKETGQRESLVIAHYYCELAEQAFKAGDNGRAGKMVKKALATDSNCVRASLLQGRLEMERGNFKAAVRAYTQVQDQDADFLTETLDPLVECYQRLGNNKKLTQYLSELFHRNGGAAPMLALTDMLEQQQGSRAAVEFIATQLTQRPSIRGVNRLVELGLINSQGESREILQTLKDLLGQLMADKPAYKCHQCGFKSKSLFWQCPSCKTWSSVKPVLGLPGE